MSISNIQRQVSCADDDDYQSLSVEDARKRIFEKIKPIQEYEKLALRETINRILAEDIISAINVPGHTNSAMDGYALAGDDLPAESSRTYQVIGTAFAGAPFAGTVASGQCVRIMTGGVMPAGSDTVVMQEHVERIDNMVRIGDGHCPGQNVRQAGEDIAKGSVVLQHGKRITPADLGVTASLGFGELSVQRRPRVSFFSSGDELRSIGDGKGEALAKGEIYDSNRYSLYGMLHRLEVDILDMGVIRDDPDSLREALEHAANTSDMVITSGGVSVGEADYIKPILDDIGDIDFWKVAMKPGRPLTFGHIGDALFFGLPGNPVSVMTTFYQFVQPAIHYLASGFHEPALTLQAVCSTAIRKRPGRFEFQRGILSLEEDGSLVVTKTGQQGSGLLTSMSQANCFILLAEDCSDVEAKATVTVQPFSTFI